MYDNYFSLQKTLITQQTSYLSSSFNTGAHLLYNNSIWNSTCSFNSFELLKLSATISVHCSFFVCYFVRVIGHWNYVIENIKARNKRDSVYAYISTNTQRLIGIHSVYAWGALKNQFHQMDNLILIDYAMNFSSGFAFN